jgi:hypothetical protein
MPARPTRGQYAIHERYPSIVSALRVGHYARVSSALQSEASIPDQQRMRRGDQRENARQSR